jgi:putative oxidoreductase
MRAALRAAVRPIRLPHWSADLLVAIPRVVCGWLLTVQFGAPKFGLPWSDPDRGLGLFEVAFWFPADVAAFGGPFALAPALFAWLGAFAEGVGGIAWLLGLQVRLFSLLVAATMLVAIFGQQWKNGLWNMLPAMGILWVALFTFVLGSGRFGIDALLTGRERAA